MLENSCMKPSATDIFKQNLIMLMAKTKVKSSWIATHSGVSKRMIDYIVEGERTPTIDTANKIAECFGLAGWQMQMPSLPYDIAKSGVLDHLIDVFTHSDKETRNYTLKVMERDAEYNKAEGTEEAKPTHQPAPPPRQSLEQ